MNESCGVVECLLAKDRWIASVLNKLMVIGCHPRCHEHFVQVPGLYLCKRNQLMNQDSLTTERETGRKKGAKASS
jgi:hypothetical protein